MKTAANSTEAWNIQTPTAEEILKRIFGDYLSYFGKESLIRAMEEYASIKTKALEDKIQLLQIRDEKREARESNINKENGSLHADVERLSKSNKELLETLALLQPQLEAHGFKKTAAEIKELIEKHTPPVGVETKE